MVRHLRHNHPTSCTFDAVRIQRASYRRSAAGKLFNLRPQYEFLANGRWPQVIDVQRSRNVTEER